MHTVSCQCSVQGIASTRSLHNSSLVLAPVGFKPFTSNSRNQQPRRLQLTRQPSKQIVSASGDDELPPWARKEEERKLRGANIELPFGVFLLTSAVVAIAATGSWFEIANKNAVFGVLQPDNPLWAIILGFFGVTGYPTAGFLFWKGIQAANKEFERADEIDGY